MSLDLDAIKARADSATPGPWAVAGRDDDDLPWVIALDGESDPWWVAACAMDITLTDGCDNAEFIAHARTDVPALVAEVERLRAQAVQYRQLVIHANAFANPVSQEQP